MKDNRYLPKLDRTLFADAVNADSLLSVRYDDEYDGSTWGVYLDVEKERWAALSPSSRDATMNSVISAISVALSKAETVQVYVVSDGVVQSGMGRVRIR
jgi:hypothetical protein